MKKNRRLKASPNSSLKTVAFFCSLVLGLVIVSLIFKFTAVVQKSKFDDSHRLNVVLARNPVEVVSFAPDSQAISILRIQSQTRIEPSKINLYLKIPIDATVAFKNTTIKQDKIGDQEELDSLFKEFFLNFQSLNSDLTVIDIFRIWLFTRGLNSHEVILKEIKINNLNLDSSEELMLDKTASELFPDAAFAKENFSIQIINGTGVNGIGNKFARLISNIGGNVVSVETADQDFKKSEILSVNNSYSVEKLAKNFGFSKNLLPSRGMYDIVVRIGSESSSLPIFQ